MGIWTGREKEGVKRKDVFQQLVLEQLDTLWQTHNIAPHFMPYTKIYTSCIKVLNAIAKPTRLFNETVKVSRKFCGVLSHE